MYTNETSAMGITNSLIVGADKSLNTRSQEGDKLL